MEIISDHQQSVAPAPIISDLAQRTRFSVLNKQEVKDSSYKKA